MEAHAIGRGCSERTILAEVVLRFIPYNPNSILGRLFLHTHKPVLLEQSQGKKEAYCKRDSKRNN